jgi:hypothetical protein
MAASKAFYPEIRARPHDFPLLVPTGMLLSEFDDISETVSVRHFITTIHTFRRLSCIYERPPKRACQ